MQSGTKVVAEQCIEIINRRLPLTASEDRLLGKIVMNIRLHFGLENERSPSVSAVADVGPAEWFW